jgi:hypothetical protein
VRRIERILLAKKPARAFLAGALEDKKKRAGLDTGFAPLCQEVPVTFRYFGCVASTVFRTNDQIRELLENRRCSTSPKSFHRFTTSLLLHNYLRQIRKRSTTCCPLY